MHFETVRLRCSQGAGVREGAPSWAWETGPGTDGARGWLGQQGQGQEWCQ